MKNRAIFCIITIVGFLILWVVVTRTTHWLYNSTGGVEYVPGLVIFFSFFLSVILTALSVVFVVDKKIDL